MEGLLEFVTMCDKGKGSVQKTVRERPIYSKMQIFVFNFAFLVHAFKSWIKISLEVEAYFVQSMINVIQPRLIVHSSFVFAKFFHSQILISHTSWLLYSARKSNSFADLTNIVHA